VVKARVSGSALVAGGGVIAGYLVFRGLLSGAVSLDLGIGRTTHPLGPRSIHISAPPEVVFDVMAQPYLGSGAGSGDGVRLLAATSEMVLAAHRIPLPDGRVAGTVETVTFTRPERIEFQLVRGPVAHAAETYRLSPREAATHVEYTGVVSADLWALGRLWSRLVVQRWEAVVGEFLETVKAEAEGQAASASPDS
jgi:hypothetical protein